jgi:hypothetical protein
VRSLRSLTKKRNETISKSIVITILLGFAALYLYANMAIVRYTEIYEIESLDFGKTLVWTIVHLGLIMLLSEIHLIYTFFATIGLITYSFVAVLMGKFGNGYFIDMLPGYLAWILFVVISNCRTNK